MTLAVAEWAIDDGNYDGFARGQIFQAPVTCWGDEPAGEAAPSEDGLTATGLGSYLVRGRLVTRHLLEAHELQLARIDCGIPICCWRDTVRDEAPAWKDADVAAEVTFVDQLRLPEPPIAPDLLQNWLGDVSLTWRVVRIWAETVGPVSRRRRPVVVEVGDTCMMRGSAGFVDFLLDCLVIPFS